MSTNKDNPADSNHTNSQPQQAAPQQVTVNGRTLNLTPVKGVKDLGALKQGELVLVDEDYIKAAKRRRMWDIGVTAAIGVATTAAAGYGGYRMGYSAGLEAAAEDEVVDLDERRAASNG